MSRRPRLFATVLVWASLIGLAQAHAAAITWNLGVPAGLLGVSQDYTAGPSLITITATGFINGNFADPANQTALFGKNDGGDEVGLGVNDDPTQNGGTSEHELQGKNWIQIDVHKAVAAGVTNLSFAMASSTGCTAVPCTTGDSWRVFGSNSATSLGTQLPGLIGFDELTSHLLPTGFEFFNFQAVSGNALVGSISGDLANVPEPASLATLGTALFGLAWLTRSRRTRVSV